MIQDLPFLGISLQAAGVLFFIWAVQRIIDAIARFFIDKKVLSPIYKRIVRKVKIIKTRGVPIRSTFSLSFTPEEDLTVSSAVEKMRSGFQDAEQASNEKISIESQHWEEETRDGKVRLCYSDETEVFNIDINFIQDTDSLKRNSSEEQGEILVGSIGLEIDLNFPFHTLEDTLLNLGPLVSYIEDGIQNQLRGSFSGGRFVISPVENKLTIDEWIEEEKFNTSLLLQDKNNSDAAVEFFSDQAVVKPNQGKIDAQTVKYVRELLLNYYI